MLLNGSRKEGEERGVVFSLISLCSRVLYRYVYLRVIHNILLGLSLLTWSP